MKNQLNISDLVKGCCKQSRQCQKAFVDRYSGMIYAICVRYLGDREKAKDQLQITLLKILNNISSFDRKKGSLETWITRITINTCLSHLKKIKLELVSINGEDKIEIALNDSVIDDLSNEELLDIIKNLPDGYRQVFNLAIIEGYSHKEIGSMTGLTEGASRSKLSRAKEMIRLKLTQLNTFESWVNLK